MKLKSIQPSMKYTEFDNYINAHGGCENLVVDIFRFDALKGDKDDRY